MTICKHSCSSLWHVLNNSLHDGSQSYPTKMYGLKSPSLSPALEHVLRGIKKEHAKKAKPTLTRLPITPNILLKIRAAWEENAKSFDNIMLWAACCSCYFGFLRSGEYVFLLPTSMTLQHLSITDIAPMINPPLSHSKLRHPKRTHSGRE